MVLPNLYQYSDYRTFMKDAYESNKARQACDSLDIRATRVEVITTPR